MCCYLVIMGKLHDGVANRHYNEPGSIGQTLLAQLQMHKFHKSGGFLTIAQTRPHANGLPFASRYD